MSSLEAMQKRLARLHQAQKSNPRLEAEWAALCEGARDELLARLSRGLVGERAMVSLDEEDRECFKQVKAMLAEGALEAKQQFMRWHG